MKKRILSMFLAAIMLLTLVPMTAYADNEKTVTFTVKNWGDSTATSYVSSDTQGIADGEIEAVMCNFNPKSGQIKGNQTTTVGNFYIYNITKMPGSITGITITAKTSSANHFQNKMYAAVGTDSQSAITDIAGCVPSETGGESFSWTFDAADGYAYFKLLSNEKFTSGSLQEAVVTVTYSVSGPQKELVSISVDGTPTKTEYTVGESFDPTGLTVQATYSDASTADVTDNAEFTVVPETFTEASDSASIKVTAKVGTVTSSEKTIDNLKVKAPAVSYNITNDTPESDAEKNHGYITIDKTSAAEGETVTITVNPTEGYQLKSLTAVPEAETISTIADVLATVEGGFPQGTGNKQPPSNAWVCGSDRYTFVIQSGQNSALSFYYSEYVNPSTGEVTGNATPVLTTTGVIAGENCYTATFNTITLTFNMTDGKLTGIAFSSTNGNMQNNYGGTYTAPAGTTPPSAEPETITPKKQTDGTYQFTMPAYPVTVKAEFEEVGGTGKTLPYSFDFETDPFSKANGWTTIDADGDGHNWETGTDFYWNDKLGVDASHCAVSESYLNDGYQSLNTNNWLFSPAIIVPAGGAKISWYEFDSGYGDTYTVYVSETNKSTDTSGMTVICAKHEPPRTIWTQKTAELSAKDYGGKTVYIAFQHQKYDGYVLAIDNFAAEALSAPHTHTFTYTANGGKLTATCIDGCDKGYDTNPLTLTLTAPASLVYDGNAKAFTFADGEADAWTGAGLELPTIYYCQKKDYPFYLQIDSAPTDAGEYYSVKIDLNDVNNQQAEVYFAIDKATPYINTNPAPSDIDYGKKLADSTLAGGFVQISSTNSTEVAGLFEWTNPDTVPGIDDSEVTEYDVTFTPVDANNFNTVSCKVKIKVNHTHTPVLVNGQAATETAAGFKDYYKCDCGDFFEDATGNVPIENLAAWQAQGGNGYIAPLIHSITPVNGQDATDTEAGFKAYYECKSCGKYYEDATGLVEINDIEAWKAEDGNGYLAPLHGTDDNHDHICDYCTKTVSNHIDTDPKDHICDICGKTISNHTDTEPKDHICDICGKTISNHVDTDPKDHICDICGKAISNHIDTDPKNHVCDYCGKVLNNHADDDKDHICDYCGETISNHADTDNNHICDYCGKVITNHVDEDGNKDHLCDICGDVISNHEDTNKDHICDICGKAISNHADENQDHVCDYCGKTISNHEDADKNHICEYCGKVISNHNGVLQEGTAATLQSAGHKSYYKCDCGKFFEDATCKVEITDLDAWKAQGGNGYIAKLEEEPKSPQTGDNSHMTLWMMLLALSSMGLCACLVLGKKRKNVQ